MNPITGHILVVDDTPPLRHMLGELLRRTGHQVGEAVDGYDALEKLKAGSYDLIMLDIMMPRMDGYQVLAQLREDEALRSIPVIVMSALNEVDSTVRCIRLGADDYIVKPHNPDLLRARVTNLLEKKHLRDKERMHLAELEAERAKSESLLRNILPEAISERLKQGETPIVDAVPGATILFADIVDFSAKASDIPPSQIVGALGAIFTAFDDLADHYGLEKIKTIGDAYMLVGGLPAPHDNHAQAVTDMAAAMHRAAAATQISGQPLQLRIGIHSGPVIAGIIGTHKFAYDLWGHTVNIAARLQGAAEAGTTLISEATRQLLENPPPLESVGELQLKGISEPVRAFVAVWAAEAQPIEVP